ncbi:carbohydrate ABC transporter membrane protein 1 (CUT1 family) [Halanaerobium saccharolyticum]|uniref:Carbohydrate ABC transporter membrane protein 1 (CUT1 family) n=1 Tax=Halanaerobium saccharolyticum TaxID=43595 RepID=A0A4R6LZZ7_9FIRM|nr:sugar ABC transporter permease [Halanaerobium saccharolyticum]TDO94216.1 carbohydrate ABC transporter membrane protein 1 (CUT1 family) [Halanaerobium saccharolyticum]
MRKRYLPYLFIMPAVIFMLLIVAYPILLTFRSSLFHEVLIRPWEGVEFVGMDNFVTLIKNQEFWSSLQRTAIWTVSSVLGKTLIGLSIAILLNQKFKFRGIYRTLILIPWVTPQVVSAIIWRWVYNGEYGMLNYVLMRLGLINTGISWLGHKTTAFIAAVINDMWIGIPFMIVVFLSGLQGIPNELYEAAKVDGANRIQTLFKITLPQLKPVFLTATILSIIWTFNSFNIIWVLTKGGPVNATETLVIKTYKEAFGKFDIGMGSTYAVTTFILLMIFSLFYWRMFSEKDEI